MKKAFFWVIISAAAALSLRSLMYQLDHYSIPVQFDPHSQIPHTSIEIEGKTYEVEIDLGTKMPLSLHQNVLANINKNPCGSSRRMDFQGKRYETPLFLIPTVKLGSLSARKIKTREESYDFAAKGSVFCDNTGRTEKEIAYLYSGRIGREFFAGKNLFMDFHNSVFMACHNVRSVPKIKDQVEVPFQNSSAGIILEVETDMGIKKFALDTGTTISVIRAGVTDENKNCYDMPAITTSKFIMNGNDFGCRKLGLLAISPLLSEIDGLLGMDFLKEHAIYLDFKKNIAYIGKSSNLEPQAGDL